MAKYFYNKKYYISLHVKEISSDVFRSEILNGVYCKIRIIYQGFLIVIELFHKD